MVLIDAATGRELLAGIAIRSTFRSRMVGYIGQGLSVCPRGMLLLGTRRVHTLFMSFPLDLFFLGSGLEVLGTLHEVAPFRFPVSARGSRHVLEIPSPSGSDLAIRRGDRLAFIRQAVEEDAERRSLPGDPWDRPGC